MQLSALSLAMTRVMSGAYTPSALFAAGEQAVWFDPSDISTLYQDAAGTTPVTAMEQPVGKMLDKSGRGNHCTFKAGTGRPVLSAKYNLLMYTEDFSNAAWAKAAAGTGITPIVTKNYAVAPDGTMTAQRMQLSLGGGSTTSDRSFISQLVTFLAGSHKNLLYVKANGAEEVGKKILHRAAAGNVYKTTTLTAEWQQVSWEETALGGAIAVELIALRGNTGGSSSTADVLVWHPDVRPTNDGIGLPAYQRVVNSATYDTAGFPPYLRADGTDDGGSTNSIDFTSTDKVTVFAGVRKLSDAAIGTVCELSATYFSNNGAFALWAPDPGAANFRFGSKGTVGASNVATDYASPISKVVTGIGDISGDVSRLRVNGTAITPTTTDQGTGNYGNYPLFLFARNNASLYFNGRLYGLIVLGRAATAMEIANTERYLNQRGRIY